MTFSNYIKAAMVLLLTLSGFSFGAKAGTGKVTFVNGDVSRQKGGKTDWEKLRDKQNVKQSDKIRTLIESRAVIALPDGSSISIEENSLVELTELLSEDGKNKFEADIKSGRMKFDVQKQANKESSFQFKTGTATAAIRGTDGSVGVTKLGKLYASLRNGLMEIDDGEKKYSVNGGQTAIPNPKGDGYSVLSLASSGDDNFMKTIDEILSDSTMNPDSLIKIIEGKDSAYTALLQEAKKEMKCDVPALPDTIRENNVTIKATCQSGISVEISNQKLLSEGKELEFNVAWASSAVGEKKFPVSCYVDKISAECGSVKTYYMPIKSDTVAVDTVPKAVVEQEPHIPLEVYSSSINVCDDGRALVEGAFDPKDSSASLIITMGATHSENLVINNRNGQFSYPIAINDVRRNWNEKEITVEYKSNIYGTEKATISLNINKTCPEVNLTAPTVTLVNYDSVSCVADLNISGATDDRVILTPYEDGSPLNDLYFTNDGRAKISTSKGVKNYEFIAEDQAGRKGSARATLGCYPKSSYGISISGSSNERLRTPPPPPQFSNIIHRNLSFSVTGIPGNDPAFIKEIFITQGNNVTRLFGNDIDNVKIVHPVELLYGAVTTIKIDVMMKSGQHISATKTYKVP